MVLKFHKNKGFYFYQLFFDVFILDKLKNRSLKKTVFESIKIHNNFKIKLIIEKKCFKLHSNFIEKLRKLNLF